jgi:hypothetical protein
LDNKAKEGDRMSEEMTEERVSIIKKDLKKTLLNKCLEHNLSDADIMTMMLFITQELGMALRIPKNNFTTAWVNCLSFYKDLTDEEIAEILKEQQNDSI